MTQNEYRQILDDRKRQRSSRATADALYLAASSETDSQDLVAAYLTAALYEQSRQDSGGSSSSGGVQRFGLLYECTGKGCKRCRQEPPFGHVIL